MHKPTLVAMLYGQGAGGRLDPAQVVVAALSALHGDRNAKTSGRIFHDKLGNVVRKQLAKDYGIQGGVAVVTSTEAPRKAFSANPGKTKNKASFYGTWACLPAQFGLLAASVVLNGLLAGETRRESKEARDLRTAAEAAAACH